MAILGVSGIGFWLSHAIALSAVAYAAYSADWSRLKNSQLQHVFFASCLLIGLMWTMRTEVLPPISLHFFGVTTLTLMMGWRMATVGAALAVLVAGVFQGQAWHTIATDYLILGLVPVLLSQAVLLVVTHKLPANIFVYIFGGAFVGSMIAAIGGGLLEFTLAPTLSADAATLALADYVVILPLLLFGEGFLNGAFVTMLVATRPQWILTFDDARYLYGNNETGQ
ncbi:MAG: energy-coupling factor ABC transporter permease [Pseudomonadota bacterium]|nr:energy-coupling factor ABC transporter permease [Pseudomonadota bacterium]